MEGVGDLEPGEREPWMDVNSREWEWVVSLGGQAGVALADGAERPSPIRGERM